MVWINMQPAVPEMAQEAANIMYLTMAKMADYLFGQDDKFRSHRVLEAFFRRKCNRFSHQFTHVICDSGKVVGLVISYSGRLMRSLELPMALQLVQIRGVIGFSQFLWRAFPLVGAKEAMEDEYFISNIAVLPEQQGNGMGHCLLEQVENQARDQGYKKIALTVDIENERACSLYTRIGYSLVDTITLTRLKNNIKYAGYYRMMKVLS
jgi:ribosomal protein S18 acetylase RimI-like enzyme